MRVANSSIAGGSDRQWCLSLESLQALARKVARRGIGSDWDMSCCMGTCCRKLDTESTWAITAATRVQGPFSSSFSSSLSSPPCTTCWSVRENRVGIEQHTNQCQAELNDDERYASMTDACNNNSSARSRVPDYSMSFAFVLTLGPLRPSSAPFLTHPMLV